ncbi:peptidoglycan-binding protein [Streptomyces albipurpureus]|uniref:Peptidoglycan-binding protein n=1 Tax=Streptomyces albipurpureus TaxID=2897419 RepID=A0ABT0US03_9ACTN|nr:peptidoglycan-binding protein [Streptomyces sp. CWNU-1]MCM2390845.1 peptidoglycan-binding protein [Streptomyces sp. CWNU-1]
MKNEATGHPPAVGETAVEEPLNRTPTEEASTSVREYSSGTVGAPLPGAEDTGGSRATGSRRRRRRRRAVLVALAALTAGGAVAAAAIGFSGESGASDGAGSSGLPPNTTRVTRQSLADVHRADGILGYGQSVTAFGRLPGTITAMPETGDRIARGKALYEVDNRPVILLYGSVPAYRALKDGVEGPDVQQLERNLSALGYTGFTVDEEFTDATADAVKEWQEDIGLEETGTVDLGRVVFAPGKVRIDGQEAEVSGQIGQGGKVLSYTGLEKAVTVELEVAEQRLAKEGSTVTVTLPDESVVKGRIEEVSTVIEPATGQEEASTKIELVVALTDRKAQKAADAYALASVNVDFVAQTRKDVLTVPVSALLALAEGGFGVEVVKDGTSSYAAVTTGLFADGRVEISGGGIAEGTTVGMAK